MQTTTKRTPLPLIAGILAIASGGFKLLSLIGLIIASFVVMVSPVSAIGMSPVTILLIITIPLAILGILAIIGGIYALQRKNFGLAVTGSITAFLPFSLLGLASIILISLARDEFEQ